MKYKIAVIGLGYVGLPLVAAFSEKFDVIAYDSDAKRVSELNQGVDKTDQLQSLYLNAILKRITLTDQVSALSDANIFILTVPTPVTKDKKPDLSFLIDASKTVGAALKKGAIVIYESTVYPGCTEEDCVPVLEEVSGLKYNTDFFCGYSPERINPGDQVNTLLQSINYGYTQAQATYDQRCN